MANIGLLIKLQCTPGYHAVPSYGWPFLAVQISNAGTKTEYYLPYLAMNVGLMALSLTCLAVWIIRNSKTLGTQIELRTILRYTAFAALVLCIWANRNFFYDLVLYHIENYDQVAYYYWEYDGSPPFWLLIPIWLGMILGFDLILDFVSKVIPRQKRRITN